MYLRLNQIAVYIHTIFFMVVCNGYILAQCGISEKIIIKDEENGLPDTSLVSIVISGAENNDLAQPDQGLCAVGIRFKHPFVKEFLMELISPSGQTIMLTGGNTTAYFTQFVTWDVKFVQSPPNGTAAPDPGFSEVWDNDQDWENFKTYKGDYYPHMGQLQQFNTGAVNGTWSLRCIDLADFGEGEILSFNLFFCDDRGLSCSQCKLDAGVFNTGDMEFCSGSPELLLNIDKTFTVFPQQSGLVYNYTNVIFQNDSIRSIESVVDLRSASPDTYTVCPLQYALPDQDKIPQSGTIHDRFSLNAAFLATNACAAVSDSCIQITINDDIPVTKINADICKGDSIVLNGTVLKNEGIYSIKFSTGVCDSLVELDLKVIDIKVNISADQDSLNCFNNTLSLIGNISGTPVHNTMYRWYGKENGVDSDSTDFIADISVPGWYFLEVTGTSSSLTCRSTDSIQIFQDNSVPSTSLSSGILTCTDEETEIIISSTRPVINTIWESEDNHTIIPTGNGAIVSNPGKYIVTIIADNGCSVLDSISVLADQIVGEPTFISDTLNCINSIVQIVTTHADNRVYTYEWKEVNPDQTNMKDPLIFSPGTYSLSLTDNHNGCSDVFFTEIIQEIILPEISDIVVDTITCAKLGVTPVITSDLLITDYNWIGPGTNTNVPAPILSSPGMYMVTITAQNGCKKDSFFTVSIDTLKPQLQINAEKLTCLKDSVTITIMSDQEIITYLWSGPAYNSNVAIPTVSQPGLYFVSVTTSNSCIGTGQVLVENDSDIPSATFSVPPISCIEDTVRASVSIPPGAEYSYFWTGPEVLQPEVPEPQITIPGIYQITVTDVNTDCTATFTTNVRDDRIYPTASISSEPINCIKDSVQIVLNPNMALINVNYIGPEGFLSNQQSPFVRKEGWYFVTFTNNLSCTTLDSVFIERNDRFPVITVPDFVIKCKQDSITLSANSDIPGTDFRWTGPEGFDKVGNTVQAYIGGNYILSGKAPNQCEEILSFTIGYDTLAPDLSISTPDVLTCKSPQTSIQAQSLNQNVVFRWEGPQAINGPILITNLPGSYKAIATAPNNCEASVTVEVTENKNFPEFMTIADTMNCQVSASSVSIITDEPTNKIFWSSGNPVIIPDNAFSFSTTTPGTYDFMITNTEECTSEGSIVVVKDIALPEIVSILSDSITCANPVITLSIFTSEPGLTYQWFGPGISGNNNVNTIQVTEGGIYFAVITGKNFCIRDTQILIIKNRSLPEFTTFSDTLTCDQGKITIGVNPISDISSYFWSGNGLQSTSRTPIVFTPGLYSVTVTNSNGCSSEVSILVPGDFEKPEFEIRDTFYLPCDSSATMLSVIASDSLKRFKWTFPDGAVSSEKSPFTNTEGDYIVQVVGLNGCLSEVAHFYVGNNPDPIEFKVNFDSITCLKPSATLSASTGEKDVRFEWINPSGLKFTDPILITGLAGGYKLIAIDTLNCRDTLIFAVVADTISPVITITQDVGIQCESKSVTLMSAVSPTAIPFNYIWSTMSGEIVSQPNAPSVKVNGTGIYKLEVTNLRNGCVGTIGYELLNEVQQLTQIFTTIKIPSCKGFQNGIISIDSINGVSPYQIMLNGQSTGDKQVFEFLSPGQYNVRIKDALGCILDTMLILNEALDPDFLLPHEILINFGDSVLLSPEILSAIPDDWLTQWSSVNGVICSDCKEIVVMPFVNTLYSYEISIDGKCKKSADVLVKVRNDLNTALPNIFRPGSGEGNDVFFVPQVRGIEKVVSVIIFDRWAEPVFASFDHSPGDPAFGWNGIFKGKAIQPGVFVVVAELILSDGSSYKYVGDLTLIR